MEDSGEKTIRSELRCLYTNANCLTNKLEELKIRSKGYDIVAITETWADANITDAELHLPGFTSFRVDRSSSKGGGVILYIRSDLQASVSQELTDFRFSECVWCTVKLNMGQLLLGVCYRSPSSSTSNNDTLLRLLDRATSVGSASHIMIMGDFNCPAIDYDGGFVHPGGGAFDTALFGRTSDLLLVQNVFDYTRIRSGNNPSKLDYVFTDEDDS